ncbi:Sugar or nucleoside kinase, ribokinase family [Abditibacterium utsteinense]|uniref:Sugar or nucleoside kinase, ribokinase family n=1 Tax=Abditibacterium utsteinense TaxID=1960156 RepID=A0A2S8SPW9_9BACT|nr:PfkB family carbohydrate kinase [Abditibacterium utsteinense]PQV62845.1 Sugar or nucleoside kinase, ribokinase family [Abditibacterium utsteinense]
MKTRDILGLGCATLDELLFVKQFPLPDSKTLVTHSEKQGGGLTATALVAGARLGAKCAYAGMLGFDETSDFVLRNLEDEGIDTDLVSLRDDAAAIRSLVIVDENSATRTILFERPGLVGAAPDAPSESEIAASRVLLIDHYGAIGNVRACEIARRNGVPIVADFERVDVPDFEGFFPLVDHLVLSRGFSQKMTGETSPPAVLRALWNENRKIVIVTGGEDGAWSFDGAEVCHFPAFTTQVADTTGCGDVFHGTYAATLAWNFLLPTRVQWASAAAALKARDIGAQRGIAHRAELEAFLKAQSVEN